MSESRRIRVYSRELTDEEHAAYLAEENAREIRATGKHGLKLIGRSTKADPGWYPLIDALVEIDAIDQADKDQAKISEWVKNFTCPGCGSSSGFARRDKVREYDGIRVTCGRRCKTGDVLRLLGLTEEALSYVGPDGALHTFETPPTVKVMNLVKTPVTSGNVTPPVVKSEETSDEVAPWWSESITAADLDKIEYPPLSYLVSRLLAEGSVALLAGPPKIGKSYLSTGVACGVATGSDALDGLACIGPHPVLLVSLDDQSRSRLQRRLRQVLRGQPLPETLTLHTAPNLGAGRNAADSLIAYLNQHPATRLVIVDTLEHLRGDAKAGESAYRADVRFLTEMRRVVAVHPKVTLLCLAHTRKGEDDDPISAVSGTHGVTGGADALLVVTGKRGAPRRMLDVISRDGEDSRLVLAWTDHGLSITDDDPDDPTILMTADQALVYKAVRDSRGPVSAKDLATFEELQHLASVGNLLAKLAGQGHLKRTGWGKYETP